MSKLAHEIATYLFFVLLAGFYWLIQTLNSVHEAKVSIPLALTDIPDNVVITDGFPSHLKLKIKDKGTAIMNYKFGHNIKTLNVKFSNNQGGSGYVMLSPYKLREILRDQFDLSTNLLSITPDTLGYYYTTGQQKRVPIKLDVSFKTDADHYVRDSIVSEDSVTVFAPTKILDNLTEVVTRHDVLAASHDTLRTKLNLIAPVGAKLSMPVLDATFIIDRYTQKKLEVPLEGLSFPENMALRSFPATVSVTCRVGAKDYADVTFDDFLIGVRYATLKSSKNDTYRVSVFRHPSSVKVISVYPKRADFLIENYSLKKQ